MSLFDILMTVQEKFDGMIMESKMHLFLMFMCTLFLDTRSQLVYRIDRCNTPIDQNAGNAWCSHVSAPIGIRACSLMFHVGSSNEGDTGHHSGCRFDWAKKYEWYCSGKGGFLAMESCYLKASRCCCRKNQGIYSQYGYLERMISENWSQSDKEGWNEGIWSVGSVCSYCYCKYKEYLRLLI